MRKRKAPELIEFTPMLLLEVGEPSGRVAAPNDMLMNQCLAVFFGSEHVLPPCVPINVRLYEGAFF